MEVVNTTVITPLALITAPATLDIDYFLIGINVQVIIELVVCYTCMYECMFVFVCMHVQYMYLHMYMFTNKQ